MTSIPNQCLTKKTKCFIDWCCFVPGTHVPSSFSAHVPTVKKLPPCELTRDTSYNAGFGPTNEVLIDRSYNETITKYKFYKYDRYRVEWKKPVPEKMTYDCYKFITSTGKIILHDTCTTTHMYTSDLELESRHKLGGDMHLLAVSTDILMYVNYHDEQKVIDIYNMNHERIQRMMPPHDRKWKWQLSGCILPESGNVMVADNLNNWLDMFSAGGRIIFRFYIYSQCLISMCS